jgi:hypothetical protein
MTKKSVSGARAVTSDPSAVGRNFKYGSKVISLIDTYAIVLPVPYV